MNDNNSVIDFQFNFLEEPIPLEPVASSSGIAAETEGSSTFGGAPGPLPGASFSTPGAGGSGSSSLP